MSTEHYTLSPRRLNWFGATSLLALIAVVYFVLSVGVSLMWWGATLFNPDLRSGLYREVAAEFSCFTPAACLLFVSLMVYRLALLRRPARRMFSILILSSLAFFWTDVHFRRYQVSVDIAEQSYWDDGGLVHFYFTWWWYNDGGAGMALTPRIAPMKFA